ncbi:MAG TPA: acetylxylan esterase [Polyangia bacterium]
MRRRFALVLLLAAAGCRPAAQGESAVARDAATPARDAAPAPEPPPAVEGPYRPARFDLTAARDARDIGLTEMPGTPRVVDGVAVREIRFTSSAWDARGRARPIRIQAYLAIPPGAYAPHTKPAVILAHGLGWHGTAQEAVEVCRNIDVVALSISAPGLGGSEGVGVTPDEPRPLFATVPDIRQSWLYQYVYTILRAITLVQTLPQTDPRGIVLTGVSMGGVSSLIAGGVDDRVQGVMVVSAAGGLEESVRQGSWWRRLVLSAGGLKPEDPGPQALFRALDPLAFAPRQHGAVFMVIGAQDEFFPLDRAIATYEAIRAPAKSLEVIADYDHSWYFGAGCPARCMPGARPRPKDCPPAPTCPQRCPPLAKPPYCGPQGSYNNQDNFIPRWALLLRSLVAQHAAHPARPFGPPPGLPTVERRARDIIVRPAPGPAPKAVRLAYSDNQGYTFGHVTLTRGADGRYHLGRGLPPKVDLFLAEVEAEDGAVATSIPTLPADYRPPIRPFGPQPR